MRARQRQRRDLPLAHEARRPVRAAARDRQRTHDRGRRRARVGRAAPRRPRRWLDALRRRDRLGRSERLDELAPRPPASPLISAALGVAARRGARRASAGVPLITASASSAMPGDDGPGRRPSPARRRPRTRCAPSARSAATVVRSAFSSQPGGFSMSARRRAERLQAPARERARSRGRATRRSR